MIFSSNIPESTELISFINKVDNKELFVTINSYLWFLFFVNQKNEKKIELNVTISFENRNVEPKTYQEAKEVLNYIFNNVPFELSIKHNEFFADDIISEDFVASEIGIFSDEKILFEQLTKFKDIEGFSYKCIGEYSQVDWYLFANTISNGMINPHIEKLSNDYIFENNIEKWFGCFIDMDAVYDFENNPDVLEYIRNIVRKHIPDDEIEYCEDSWDEGNTQNILAGIQWLPNSILEVNDFIEELNLFNQSIGNEIRFKISDYKRSSTEEHDEDNAEMITMWVSFDHFAIVELIASKDGLYLVGTDL